MAKYIKVISEGGKVYKLRVGAVCRNCKCDLSLESGNICKSCNNEYYRARRKGIWSW